MRVEVHGEGAGNGFAAAARRAATQALAGHAGTVERVRVSTEAGDGAQVLCRFEVRGLRAWQVIVEEVDPDAHQALERAACRAAVDVAHTLERVGRTWTSGPQPWPSTRAS
ncbi:MAG TPA: hypothetical protein VGK67_03780 [Myxococcales bacterium]|jgi:hypothetical protein